MKRSIIVTDLTRFGRENPHVCIAGIDRKTGECIRPIPYLTIRDCNERGLRSGMVLTGEFTAVPDRSAPHLEDHYHAGLISDEQCSESEFKTVLLRTCSTSVEEGFGITLTEGAKHLLPGNDAQRSIITLKVSPDSIEVADDLYKKDGIRLHFTDSGGRRHRFFPITDLGFYNFSQRFRKNGSLADLAREITTQEEVFLRVGLSRRYKSPQDKDGFWLQVNGIYTFPKALPYIRSNPQGGTSRI